MARQRPSFAVIGDPVEHSLSPRLFAHFAQEVGLDLHYTALRVRSPELAEVVDRVRRGYLSGLSVTIPHKEQILDLLDELHPLARRIGAANCVARTAEGRALGHNTDAAGFRTALERQGRRLAAARVVLLGAGGAARAAAFACTAAGAKSLTLVNRSVDRATSLGHELCHVGYGWPEGELLRAEMKEHPAALRGGPSGKCYVAVLPLEAKPVAQAIAHADVLVNATSVGLEDPDADPLPAGVALHPGLAVLDMVYRPLQTALLRRAARAGALCIDGLWMLLDQAVEQLRIWTGAQLAPEAGRRVHAAIAREVSQR